MAGARFNGVCYSSESAAMGAAYSGVGPSLDSSGLVVLDYNGGAWRVVRYDGGSAVASWAAPALSLAPCDPASLYADGALLGAAVGGVWLVAWGVRMVAAVLVGRSLW